jgi:cyclopropane fatty-acyl-phospholipid synthase-like methyltransferase
MLDFSAGLGGPARTIAESFNTYVTGYERDSELARRATDETAARGLSRHVQISAYDPESFELRAGFYDHALAREATYTVTQKERFLRVLNQAMKPFGQLILTDFVLDRAAGDRPELAAWEGMQQYKPHLWTAAQYSDCFKSLGFDLRIANDITPDYRKLILFAWKSFLERGELRRIKGPQAAPVIDEVERGLRTVAALESGALKVSYFVALGGRRRAT